MPNIPYVSMTAHFRLLTKKRNGKKRVLTKNECECLSVGGFSFVVDGKTIPFDFEATAISEDSGKFVYESGYGPFFNAFYLDDCYDDEYEKLGVSRVTLTASALASVCEISEFYVSFCDADGREYGTGDNLEPGADFTIELMDISFTDEKASVFTVDKNVLCALNRKE